MCDVRERAYKMHVFCVAFVVFWVQTLNLNLICQGLNGKSNKMKVCLTLNQAEMFDKKYNEPFST